MESVQMEELTSGASTRLIPLFRNLKGSLLSWRSLRRIFIFIQSFFLWFLLLLPRNCLSSSSQSSSAASKSSKRKWVFKRDEEDALRRRALAEGLEMVFGTEDGTGSDVCRWSNSVFFGTRRNALFCRTWVPVSGEIKNQQHEIYIRGLTLI